jgi:hypothetical protein
MAAIDPAALGDFLPDILVIDVTNQEEPLPAGRNWISGVLQS